MNEEKYADTTGRLITVNEKVEFIGLTRRELFAAMAMQGYCSGKIGEMDFQKVAELAVKQADALLENLSKNI